MAKKTHRTKVENLTASRDLTDKEAAMVTGGSAGNAGSTLTGKPTLSAATPATGIKPIAPTETGYITKQIDKMTPKVK